MEEKINEIRDYLPIYFESKENDEYIEYLTSAYLKNLEAEKYQFAFIAFHMLYMSFVYKTIWLLKKNGDKTKFESIINICRRKNDLGIYTSLFDISVLGETESFNFLQILLFHKNELAKFSYPVEVRNHCSHASGKVHYNAKYIEEYISREIDYATEIHAKSEPLIKKLFLDFFNQNWNPNEREWGSGKDSIEDFIRKNSFSSKDIEYLTKLDLPELKSKSNVQKIIYIKVLYLVFLLIARKFVEYEKDIFFKKLPILLEGFEEQNEIRVEELVNDEFSLVFSGLSIEDKKKFEDILKIKLDQNI
jgi:hypothetical protein